MIEGLARRLAALPALPMRQAALRDVLMELPADAAAQLCGEIVRRGRDGTPWDSALLSLCAVLDGDALGYERHGEIYAAARARGDDALALLLLSAAPPPPGTPRAAPIPAARDVTLGERKSLARGRDRLLLDRLLRDPDPTVLAILLANPYVTEADVVRLAARRPTTGAAQRTIFGCERFITRYAVKRALVFNPYTPSDLAARLAVLLTKTDLRHLVGDSSLPEAVRTTALVQLNDD